MIYLDNAATAHPRPESVGRAALDYLERIGASPGRSGYRAAAAAGRILYRTRKALAKLFALPDPGRIIFCANATDALNLALCGLLENGDRVLCGPFAHNAVMRPLRHLEKTRGISVDILPPGKEYDYDLPRLEQWCAERSYRLAVFNHVSNVTGTPAPLEQILPRLRRKGIISVIDGAQSAGRLPLDLGRLAPDIYCFTGHKGLFGPPGTGGLYLKDGIAPRPLRRGGTGSRSEEETQPDFLPDRYEAGTPNTMGIAGLGAGAEFILATGSERIAAHERQLTAILKEGLRRIPRVRLYEPRAPAGEPAAASAPGGPLSFTIEGLEVGEIGFRLEREFGILTRVGLHCAPRAHLHLGTFPAGTVRLAPGWFNRPEEMEAAVAAIKSIAAGV